MTAHSNTIPISPPVIDFPASDDAVKVSLIDSTTHLGAPLEILMGPQISGHENFSAPSYAFLIEHSGGRRIMFDLGMRKDIRNMSPKVYKMITQPGWDMTAQKNVAEILEENGVSPSQIEAVVWSHWHYDHLGDMTTFPATTKLIVGPGFHSLLPGYPANPESSILESDLAGRELVELDFSRESVQIGGFRAIDYFGDGSFYLLDAPGHAVGHLCGLARTIVGQNGEADTFILMAADTCHHSGLIRPTKYLPLPSHIHPSPINSGAGSCPGSLFQCVHRNESTTEEFYQMAKKFPYNYTEAETCLKSLEEMDALDNVFVVLAHDAKLQDPLVNVPLYPTATLNDWRQQDLANKARWLFLRDFEVAAASGKKQEDKLADGIVLDH